MHAANLEQIILDTLRQLPPEQQQEVLDFTEFLQQKTSKKSSSKPSLRDLAAMPLQERRQFLAQSIPATANDFLTDPELTEFAVLDAEDWVTEHD